MQALKEEMKKDKKIQCIFWETTVFNYYFDEDREGHEDVVRLFQAIKDGKEFEPYTSTYVVEELKKAPEPKRSNMLALIDDYNITVLVPSSKIRNLGHLYIENGMLHLRTGSMQRAWSFRKK